MVVVLVVIHGPEKWVRVAEEENDDAQTGPRSSRSRNCRRRRRNSRSRRRGEGTSAYGTPCYELKQTQKTFYTWTLQCV